MATPLVPTDQLLDATMNAFHAAFDNYFPPLIVWGARLLTASVFLGFGYAILTRVSARLDWVFMISALLYAAVRIAIVKIVMVHIWDWGGALPLMGKVVGSDVSGLPLSVWTPSDVFNLGLHVIWLLIANRSLGMWFNPLSDATFPFILFGVMMIWFAIGCCYLWTIIECDWAVLMGTVTVCWAGFDYTFPTLVNWFITLLRSSIKLLATLLILAIGLFLINKWTADLAGMGSGFNMNTVVYGGMQLAESLTLFVAIWRLPRIAASIIHAHDAGGSNGMDDSGGIFSAAADIYRSAKSTGTKRIVK